MICPVCNGMSTIDADCPLCEMKLVDSGRLQDFKGPYSPYDPIEEDLVQLFRAGDASVCNHAGYCPECNNRLKISIFTEGNIMLQSFE